MQADDRHTQATHYTDGSGAYHLRFVGKDVRADRESSSNESTRLVSVPQWVRFRTYPTRIRYHNQSDAEDN
jgi:hypothetical protein